MMGPVPCVGKEVKLLRELVILINEHLYVLRGSPNQAVIDTTKKCRTLKEVLETTHDITTLIKYSS